MSERQRRCVQRFLCILSEAIFEVEALAPQSRRPLSKLMAISLDHKTGQYLQNHPQLAARDRADILALKTALVDRLL